MTTASRLLSAISKHCKAVGIKETTFGLRAVNDGKLVKRLRNGGSVTLGTLERIESALGGKGKEARK